VCQSGAVLVWGDKLPVPRPILIPYVSVDTWSQRCDKRGAVQIGCDQDDCAGRAAYSRTERRWAGLLVGSRYLPFVFLSLSLLHSLLFILVSPVRWRRSAWSRFRDQFRDTVTHSQPEHSPLCRCGCRRLPLRRHHRHDSPDLSSALYGNQDRNRV
jgi:hypothetical protein